MTTQRTYSIHGHPLAGPGCLVEPKHRETDSKRLFVARLESVCVGLDISERNMMLARNRIHTRNGRSSPLLVYIDILALVYILHALAMCCVVIIFTLYRILNRTSRSAALPCPALPCPEHGCRRCRHPCGALAVRVCSVFPCKLRHSELASYKRHSEPLRPQRQPLQLLAGVC